MSDRQRRLSREEFRAFLRENKVPIYVNGQYSIEPCRCGDMNCRGWKLVEARAAPVGESRALLEEFPHDV